MTSTGTLARPGIAVGECPSCGAELVLVAGRIPDHHRVIVRGGRTVEDDWCPGRGAPPDVDVTGLDPVVAQIVTRRQAKGWTRRELASVAGVDRESVARMERGESAPKLPFLRAVLSALEADIVVVSGCWRAR